MGATLGLSVGRRVVPQAKSPKVRSPVETIIIFRIGSLGDTVVALPCFHQVARKFPNSRRILVTDRPASPKAASVESVLGKSGLIDGAIYFSPPPRRARDFMELHAQIRQTNANTLVYIADRNLFSTLRDLCFFRWCGIRNVIGAPVRRDLRRPRIDPETGETEQEAVRQARCLAPLGTIDLNDREFWDLHLQPSETAAAENSLTPLGGREFIAINAGGKVLQKDWGDTHWNELLRLMMPEYKDFALVLFGSEDEFDRCGRLAADWPGPTLNLCGKRTPRESAAVMKRATLFVGHDSGPMHLAAAVGVPCVAMLGDFNPPKRWHPFGAEHRIIHNMRGVREITPDEVYAAVCSMIAEISGRGGPQFWMSSQQAACGMQSDTCDVCDFRLTQTADK
jgi:heptosyltransferase-3